MNLYGHLFTVENTSTSLSPLDFPHCGVCRGPLCTPSDAMDLICVDRDGSGNNCEELLLEEESWLRLTDN